MPIAPGAHVDDEPVDELHPDIGQEPDLAHPLVFLDGEAVKRRRWT